MMEMMKANRKMPSETSDKSREKKIHGKKPQWYKDQVLKFMKRNATYDHYIRAKIQRSYDYYYGSYENAQYENLLTINENTPLTDGITPFVKLNFDVVSSKVNTLLGEHAAKGINASVKVRGFNASKRKSAFEKQIRFLMQMQPLYKNAAQYSGIDFGINEELPKDDLEFQEYMDEYRDVFEILMQEYLDEWIDDHLYFYRRKNLFLDLLTSNHIFAKVERKDKMVDFRRVHPLNAIPDRDLLDDYFSGMVSFIEAEYLSIPEVIALYPDLDKKTIDDFKKDYQDKPESYKGIKYQKNAEVFDYYFKPFIGGEGSETKILVLHAQWKDVENVHKILEVDDEGNTHLNRGFGVVKGKKNQEVVNREIEITRKATLIAGEFVVDCGLVDDLYRSVKDPSVSHFNYVCAVHNYNDQKSVSLVDRIGELQDFRNYIMTLAQKEITTRIGGVYVIDKSQIDPITYGTGTDALNNLIAYAKSYNIIITNKAEDDVPGMPGSRSSSPIETKNLAINQIIKESLELALWIEREVQSITGINEARQGNVGNRELVRTTQLKLNQSNMTTATYSMTFDAFEKMLFEKVSYMTAKVWAESPEVVQEIADRLSIQLPEEFHADMEAYKIDIVPNPITADEFVGTIKEIAAAGHLPFDEYIRLREMASSNIKNALRRYKLFLKRKRRREDAQMQMQMQANQAAIAQKSQGDLKNKIAVSNNDNAWKARLKEMDIKAGREKQNKEIEKEDRHKVSDRVQSVAEMLYNKSNGGEQ